MARMRESTFTFAHLVTPHPPYLFDRSGMATLAPAIRAAPGSEGLIFTCISNSLEFPDGPAKVYIKRCKTYKRKAPAASWDGVFNITVK